MGETTVSQAKDETSVPEEYLLDLTKGPDNSQQAAPAPEQAAEPEQDPLPEKYKGKTLPEIIEMHRNAESELGRARNEIGNVRRLADELLGIRTAAAQPVAANPPARKKLTADDLLADPESSVVSIAKEAADERTQSAEQRLARMEYELALGRFEQKHPTFRETMEDEGFRAWVQKSPLRTRLAYGATQGDFAAADELFSLYSEVQGSGERQEEAQRPNQSEQARRATLARPGGSTASRVVNSQQGKPIWSREKLLEMRMNNPEEFERLQPQILEAYAEKRVR
jgi:hypothetical protein